MIFKMLNTSGANDLDWRAVVNRPKYREAKFIKQANFLTLFKIISKPIS